MSTSSTITANLTLQTIDGIGSNAGQTMLNRIFPQFSFPSGSQIFYSGFQYTANASGGGSIALLTATSVPVFVIRNAGTTGYLGVAIKTTLAQGGFTDMPTLSPGGIFAVFNYQNTNAYVTDARIYQDITFQPVIYEYLYAY
jgi:hypothetical protein